MPDSCKRIAKLLPVSLAWTILISTTISFYYFILPDLMRTYHFSIAIVQSLLTLFVVSNFFLAACMDPGVIPKASPEEDQEDDFRAPLYKTVDINGTQVRMKWCITCQFYRPPRCSHCSNCNTCVEVFDHHCPWVNNCIGRRNYRHFFCFLIFLSIDMIAVFVWCILFLVKNKDNIKDINSNVCIVMLVLLSLLFIPILGLTGFHIYLVGRGRTTNEQVTGKYAGIYNPFSQGCLTNFCLILCGPRYPKRKIPKMHLIREMPVYMENVHSSSPTGVQVYLDDELISKKPIVSSSKSKKPLKTKSRVDKNQGDSSRMPPQATVYRKESLSHPTDGESSVASSHGRLNQKHGSNRGVSDKPRSPPPSVADGQAGTVTSPLACHNRVLPHSQHPVHDPSSGHYHGNGKRKKSVDHNTNNTTNYPVTMIRTLNGKTETTFGSEMVHHQATSNDSSPFGSQELDKTSELTKMLPPRTPPCKSHQTHPNSSSSNQNQIQNHPSHTSAPLQSYPASPTKYHDRKFASSSFSSPPPSSCSDHPGLIAPSCHKVQQQEGPTGGLVIYYSPSTEPSPHVNSHSNSNSSPSLTPSSMSPTGEDGAGSSPSLHPLNSDLPGSSTKLCSEPKDGSCSPYEKTYEISV